MKTLMITGQNQVTYWFDQHLQSQLHVHALLYLFFSMNESGTSDYVLSA